MSIEQLKVYQESYKLALEIHRGSLEFPKIEQYSGIADQLRRSSKSISSNIAEGYAKQNFYPLDFIRYLVTALASSEESVLWVRMSRDLGYIDPSQAELWIKAFQKVGKMLNNLIKVKKQSLSSKG